MTPTSFICNLIADNNYDKAVWMSFLTNDHHGIFVKEDGPLAMFNYGIAADFYDPVVREARGIIINTEKAEVVCWPFEKFGKYDEGYAATIDWNTARVQEKLDGSIIKLWFNVLKDKWQWSTSGMMDANDALMSTGYGGQGHMCTFMEFITQSDNYKDIDLDKLDKNNTYIFELVGPGNRVIVPYDEYHLYHIGTRSNITGQEFNIDIGISKPMEFKLSNLDECINYVTEVFNTDEHGMIGKCDNEGFVVVDANWHRIKIKSPIYMQLHSILNNSFIGKKVLVKMLFEEKIDIPAISALYPDLAPAFKWYDYQVSRFMYEARCIVDITRRLNIAFNGNRKEIAMRIKDHRLSPIAFIALNNPEMDWKEALDSLGLIKMTKWIPDYPKSNFGLMLNGIGEAMAQYADS